MADYMYLLENRLSAGQQKALQAVRELARAQGLTVFLVGGAVRDLTSGSPVRDLDVVVQGNALLLKDAIEAHGGVITGQWAAMQALFTRFPGGVRMEIGSTLTASYPKPGKPLYEAATILDDLRRRDFTVNAMALSLNEGSYGLLMDPTNGVADLENRQLRLVSNYGFIEDPARMVRAARFLARLGWTMDEKTAVRYETGKQEHFIKAMDAAHRGYETEEIFHEEDPLRILRKLEEAGWMKHLFPALTVAKANAVELEKLREVQTQLQMRGIQPEAAAANFPLLTAKLSATELAELKKSFVRPGFVAEVEALEGEAKEVAAQLNGKGATLPSQAWKLLQSAKPEAVLWVAYSSKSPTIQAKLKSFYTEWPKARQKVPYALMQEMRIVPELEGFDEIVEKLFYELMDGNLGTVEEMKAWLETYSPPAPPPQVHLRRPRTPKKDAKGARSRKKALDGEAAVEADGEAVAAPVDADEDDILDDEVETEEEATEVFALRGPRMPVPVAEPEPPPRPAPAVEPEPEVTAFVEPMPVPEPMVAEMPTAVEQAPVLEQVPVVEQAPAAEVPPAPAVVAPAVEAVAPVAVAKRAAAPAKAAAAKAAPQSAKAIAARALKSAVQKPAPAKAVAKLPPATTMVKAVSAKAVPAKKSAPVQAAPAKSAVPAKKVVAKAVAPAKKAVPAKAAAPAKKSIGKKR